MEGNDLGAWVSARHVATLVPTIFVRPEPEQRSRFNIFHRQQPVDPDSYIANDLMIRWIVQEGYQHNMPTEIWSFEPEPLFDALSERLWRVADRAIFRLIRWDSESDALTDMTANRNSITRVYDADPDRVDRLWTFTGFKVLPGGAP